MGYVYIDKLLREKENRLEIERCKLKTKLKKILYKIRDRYGIKEAYITGSLVRPFRWYESSDVDIAVGGCSPYILAIMGEIEKVTHKEVDIILLDEHPLANSLRRKGEKIYG